MSDDLRVSHIKLERNRHKGCVGELRAVLWFIGQGYEVCQNISPHGPVDLVAIKGGKVVLVDVKTCSRAGHPYYVASGKLPALF